MAKIEMLEIIDGTMGVSWTVDDFHVCVGDPNACETPAVCEAHGTAATPGNPIYVWEFMDMTYATCVKGMASYARLAYEEADVVIVLTHNGEIGYAGEIVFLPNRAGQYGILNPETGEISKVAYADGEGFRPATEAESDAYIDRWID